MGTRTRAITRDEARAEAQTRTEANPGLSPALQSQRGLPATAPTVSSLQAAPPDPSIRVFNYRGKDCEVVTITTAQEAKMREQLKQIIIRPGQLKYPCDFVKWVHVGFADTYVPLEVAEKENTLKRDKFLGYDEALESAKLDLAQSRTAAANDLPRERMEPPAEEDEEPVVEALTEEAQPKEESTGGFSVQYQCDYGCGWQSVNGKTHAAKLFGKRTHMRHCKQRTDAQGVGKAY